VFTATVEQARQTAEAVQAAGISARWVSGETPGDDRRRLLRAFETGAVQVLCNAQVLTEGTDIPAIDCVVMARPTRSRGLYVQSIGRGLRPSPGKEDCLIIDLVGASEEHKMIVAPVLLEQLEQEERAAEEQRRGAGSPKGRVWKRHRPPVASWVRIPDLDREAIAVDCGEHGLVVAADVGDGWMSWLLPRKGAKRIPLSDAPVDRDLAVGLGEDVARQAGSLTRASSKWRADGASDAQRQMLAGFGRALDPDASKGAAFDAITAEKAKRMSAKAGIAARTDRQQGAA
jgi:ATP-dependent helicase IRC3